MTPEELLEEWESGDSTGLRPARIQMLHNDLREHTGLPIPRARSEIESWQERMKGEVTKRLRAAAGKYEEDSEEEEESETESNED